jgi:hypothetical protein
MAVTNFVPNSQAQLDHAVFAWPAVPNGNTGQPVAYAGRERSIQVEGTFGAGGSVSIEGSNDGQNYHVLNDSSGTPLTLTAAALKTIGDEAIFIRPKVTAGDGTTALNITLAVRKNLRNY